MMTPRRGAADLPVDGWVHDRGGIRGRVHKAAPSQMRVAREPSIQRHELGALVERQCRQIGVWRARLYVARGSPLDAASAPARSRRSPSK